MQFSDDWKNLWPISAVSSAPLLKNHRDLSSIGPLLFDPSTRTVLFSSPSYITPRLAPPYPTLNLQRFLCTTSSSPLLYSTAASIATNDVITPSDYCNADDLKLNNSLQLLRCPQSSSTIYAFLPAGENLEKIGILVLSVNKESSKFEVKHNNGKPFFVENDAYQHRISRLLIGPVLDYSDSFQVDNQYVTISYMLACCNYSVSWYSIKVKRKNFDSSCGSCPLVECIGSKRFQSSVVHACWSPHVREESTVLLENGDVFLFDTILCLRNKKMGGKRLQIEWHNVDECMKLENKTGWLSCEFSWHPRILVVAHSSAVLLVDMRSGKCKVTLLLNIKNVSGIKHEGFVAMSKAGTDGFCFSIASKQLLLLCDVRKPQMPVLRWLHGLDRPNYVTVFKLSELRSNSKEEIYKWASESGYCIFLGSFWNSEFRIFCYGPDNGKPVGLSKRFKANTKFFAWGLPSEIPLSGRGCHCGTCLVREEFSRESLHRWIDWRQKSELVMGFGFVDQVISSQLCEPESFGGFFLIRLMTSGKLELQKYHAAWSFKHHREEAHKESSFDVEDNHLYDTGELKYDLAKKNQFLTLEKLREFLKCGVTQGSMLSDHNLCEDYAVNLGDDNDNLSDVDEKIKCSPFHESTPASYNLSGFSNRHMASSHEKHSHTPFSSWRSQNSASDVKKEEVIGPEIFDNGCPITLKFKDNEMNFGVKEKQLYNPYIACNLKFQKASELYQEHIRKT